MAFREPLLLLGLALVPLAAAAYVAAQRRRRRYAVRYPNTALLATVAGRDPVRHLPALLTLGAITALVVALARPDRTVAAEERLGTVVMVTDASGSMLARDVRPDRLTAAKAAARTLARELPDEYRLGLVSFGSRAESLAEPSSDRRPVLAALERLRVRGGTAMGDGLALGLEAARVPVSDGEGGTRRLPGALVLLSDGASTSGTADPLDVARAARRARVPVYTVALGTQAGVLERRDATGKLTRENVPPDVRTLQEIARATGGRFFAAPDARQLRTVYARLGTGLARMRAREEDTAAWAGGGLLLLLAGAITSLVRTGRLP